ncbi:SDR family oxidoreductase, partial [bacterium]|nr:SDR family oxidoreductase [bacterium]
MHFLQELFGIENKVAVVIGGGGVLAGCMAEGLARAGSHIAILDVNIKNAQKQLEIIKRYGVKVSVIQVDASKKEELIQAEKQIIKTFNHVDILINAPGINSKTPFFDIQEEEWERILNVNLKSMFFSCQIFGRRMIKQGEGGSIINISSASSGP